MKYIYSAVFILYMFIFSGCSEVEPNDPLYIYGIGLDSDEIGVTVSVLSAKESDKSGGGGIQGKGADSEQADTEKKDMNISVYGGKDFQSVFEMYFNDNPDIYTGTNKKYIAGKSLSEEQLTEFKVYLTNSSRLPVKKEIIFEEDPYKYLEDNAESLME